MANDLVTKRSRLRAVAPKAVPGIEDQNPNPISKTALEAGVALCETKLFYLSQLPPEQVDPNEVYKLSNALSGLTRALIEAHRFQLEKLGAIKIAHELLTAQVREQLKGNPETVQAVLTEVATAKEKLEQ